MPSSDVEPSALAPETSTPPGWLALLLAALVVAVFGATLQGEPVYDDLWLVQQNPTIRDIDRLPDALTSAYWDFLDPETASHIGYWRPLTAVALSIGFRLGDGEAWGFHAISLALHVGSSLLLLRFATRLTRSPMVGFFGALLFALHPAQVEAVAWISAINDPLYGIFAIAALDSFLAWRERGSPGLPSWSCGFLLLALLSKENAAAIVPLALALDLGRPRREPFPAHGPDPGAASSPGSSTLSPFLRPYGALVSVGFVYYLMRVSVFGDAGAGLDRITTYLNVDAAREWSLRLEILGGFLGLALWPWKLNAFRDIRPELPEGDPTLLFAGLWVLVFAILAIVLWKRRLRPHLAAWLMVPAGLSPMLLKMSSIGRFPVSDRFLYVSVAGLGIVIALLVRRVLPAKPAAFALSLIAGLYGARSVARFDYWSDEEALFTQAAEDSPDSPYVLWGLGRVMLERFQATQDLAYLDKARNAFHEVMVIHDKMRPVDPDNPNHVPDRTIYASPDDFLQANLGRGWCAIFQALLVPPHDFSFANRFFMTTIGRFPDSEGAYTGLGVSLMHMNRNEEASAAFRKALELNPKFVEAWLNQGELASRMGHADVARRSFENVVELAPLRVDGLVRLGGAYADSGNEARARELLEQARRLDPENAEVFVFLGNLEAQKGRYDEALILYGQALNLDGTHGLAFLQRGKIWLMRARAGGASLNPNFTKEALLNFERAVLMRPTNIEARLQYANLLLALEAEEEALAQFEYVLGVDVLGEPFEQQRPAIEAEVDRLRAKFPTEEPEPAPSDG